MTCKLTETFWELVNKTRYILIILCIAIIEERRSNMLLKANVTVVPRDRCSENYRNWRKLPQGVTTQQLCAGDPEGLHDTCQV